MPPPAGLPAGFPARSSVAPARLAATVLLLRDAPSHAGPIEVLMVERNAQGYFPSALVFPGGVVDADDWADHWHARCSLPHGDGRQPLADWERAVRIAGLRECWEEAAILAACGPIALAGHEPQAQPLPQLMDRLGARCALSEMVHFGHWVTPQGSPKRWDTHFLVARAPEGQLPRCDGAEVIRAEWLTPQEAIASAERNEREVVFSTRANLHRLAESRSVDEALAAARQRPAFPVHPAVERMEGGIMVRIPEEAGYPVTEGFVRMAG